MYNRTERKKYKLKIFLKNGYIVIKIRMNKTTSAALLKIVISRSSLIFIN